MVDWSKEHRATFLLEENWEVIVNGEVVFTMPEGKYGSVALDIMEKEKEKK